ncbi:MAG TPA: hypothetical protein VL728_19680 [Cyclobacteriaceae bacterium]|jgi:hypothetical protein|nr:hypothetical protein [Cyclobacteriaceae bacterium]
MESNFINDDDSEYDSEFLSSCPFWLGIMAGFVVGVGGVMYALIQLI